jgi:ribA/ribD-fused uncharacterized protein
VSERKCTNTLNVIMKYTNETTITRYSENPDTEFLFFWGGRPTNGKVTKACLSQWYEAPFVVHNNMSRNVFRTAEHWMMAQKALLFLDGDSYRKILECETPEQAKRLGRAVKRYDDEVWSRMRFDIVVDGNMHKFNSHPALKEFLLSTGDAVLVEASPYDRVWGIGMRGEDPLVRYPAQWKGDNLLGYALMEVRDRLRA